MSIYENFWALEPSSAETVLRGIELGLQVRRDEPRPAAAASIAGTASVSTEMRGSTAVVSIDGALSRTSVANFYGDQLATGYDAIRAALEPLAASPSVSSILLNIDSPGGSVAGAQELASVISGIAAEKPVAAYTNGMMASAAYWIGSATGTVYATETAQVGSIGVIMTLVDQTRANEKAGLNVHVIASGTMKAAGSPHAELTPEQEAYFQQQAGGIHAVFRASVASAMTDVDAATPEAWGDGQLFLASQARNVGLVTDIVSGIDEAVAKLQEVVLMDRKSLEAQAPELVAELIAEGRAQAEGLSAVFLECARGLMPAASAEKLDGFMRACADSAMTAEQARAMAGITFAASDEAKGVPSEPEDAAASAEASAAAPEAQAAAPAEPAADDSGARAELLAALQAATPAGIPAGVASTTPKTVRDYLLEAVGRIGA